MEKKDDGLNAISPRLHGENLFRIKEPFVKKKDRQRITFL